MFPSGCHRPLVCENFKGLCSPRIWLSGTKRKSRLSVAAPKVKGCVGSSRMPSDALRTLTEVTEVASCPSGPLPPPQAHESFSFSGLADTWPWCRGREAKWSALLEGVVCLWGAQWEPQG